MEISPGVLRILPRYQPRVVDLEDEMSETAHRCVHDNVHDIVAVSVFVSVRLSLQSQMFGCKCGDTVLGHSHRRESSGRVY